jgi:hypothetical protein
MTDAKQEDPTKATAQDIYRATEDFLHQIILLQRSWLMRRDMGVDNFVERCAMFVAFRTLARTFDLDGEFPETIEALKKLSDAITLTKVSKDDLFRAKA